MKTKLLVCDVEGTIFKAEYRISDTEYASTMWQPLARELGEMAIAEERAMNEKWERGEYRTYLDWVDDTYKMHKKFGLQKPVFDALIGSAEYMQGVQEFFRNLDREKYIPVLISGGFIELIRRAQTELHIDHVHSACEYMFDSEDGYLVSRSLVPCDFEGKYDYIKLLFNQYKLNRASDWIFIGDGKNDVEIAKKAPVSFAINAQEDLKAVATCCVDDFYQIAEKLGFWGKTGFPIKQNAVSRPENSIRPAVESSGNERIIQLENELRTVKQENTDLRGKLKRKTKYPVTIASDDDYTAQPKQHLSELLDEKKVVFVGLREDYEQFHSLDKRYKNLIVVPADDTQKDFSAYEDVDLLFIFTNCIGHSLAKKARKELQCPCVHLKKYRNIEKLITAMSNILYRECYEDLL